MPRSYRAAAPTQLHATLHGPHGTHACLTLYDECPHTLYPTAPSRRREPYLHCDLPSTSTPRVIEYINNDGTRVVETTRCSLSTAPGTVSIDRRVQDVYDSTHTTLSSIQHPKEKAMAAYLAPLVMSRHSPMMHHIRESTADALRNQTGSSAPLRSKLKPSMPTIYLVTFSTERTPTMRDFAKLLNIHVPPGASLLYTIDARRFLVPSRQMQEMYSGVAQVAQDAVLGDVGARREVERAVGELTRFVVGGGRETAMAVCCTAGTHRSVAIAECIARGVRREVRGMGEEVQVRVVVRHVHRVRGRGDPF